MQFNNRPQGSVGQHLSKKVPQMQGNLQLVITPSLRNHMHSSNSAFQASYLQGYSPYQNQSILSSPVPSSGSQRSWEGDRIVRDEMLWTGLAIIRVSHSLQWPPTFAWYSAWKNQANLEKVQLNLSTEMGNTNIPLGTLRNGLMPTFLLSDLRFHVYLPKPLKLPLGLLCLFFLRGTI